MRGFFPEGEDIAPAWTLSQAYNETALRTDLARTHS